MHVPDGWIRDQDGQLLVGRARVEELARRHGTPLFLYCAPMLRARVAAFRAAMPAGLRLHYAVKANPFAPLLRLLAPLVDGFDIASAGELRRALAAGMPATAVGFAGPGKRDPELEEAIAAGVLLNIESEGELGRAAAIARRLGTGARVALRVNPPFQLRGSGMKMGGGASPFGVDAADAPRLLRSMAEPGLAFAGLHVFAGSQALDWEAIAAVQQQTIALAAELAPYAPSPPALLTLGGGFGVPYFPADRPLDIASLGQALAAALAARPPALAATVMAVELGRWLVAEAGIYVTRVVDRKVSAGTTFLVTDGGLHHQLAASGNFGTVVRRNYPLSHVGRDGGPVEEVNVVGCLCTPLDRLGERVTLPVASPGDLIAVHMAGAYGRSASPEAFLGHPPPAELLVGE